MLTSMKPLLKVAREKKYAHAAFNVNAVCQIEAAIRIHEIMRSPVILQGAELANGFMGGRCDFMNSTLEDKKRGMANMVAAVRKFGENSPIPVVLHLDHGQNFESCKAAIDAGYTSVMIDASSKPLEENIAITREVVQYAHPRGVSVEGELGVLAGVEDHVFSATSSYTNPLDALRFVKETGVDALAISYGTMHGANKGKNVVLRKEIPIAIMEIFAHENIDASLVSHGSSNVDMAVVNRINALGGDLSNTGGISLSELRQVIESGIVKINVDTDIRLAVTRNLLEYYSLAKVESEIYELMKKNPKNFDPRNYLSPVMDMVMTGAEKNTDDETTSGIIKEAVMEVCANLISAYNTINKAEFVEALSLEELAKTY